MKRYWWYGMAALLLASVLMLASCDVGNAAEDSGAPPPAASETTSLPAESSVPESDAAQSSAPHEFERPEPLLSPEPDFTPTEGTFEWVKKPFLKSGSVRYYRTTNGVPGCVAEQKGKYGVLGFDGAWLVKPEHDRIVLSIVPDCENLDLDMLALEIDPNPDRSAHRIINADGSVYDWIPDGRCGNGNGYSFFWDEKTNRPILCEPAGKNTYRIYEYNADDLRFSIYLHEELGSVQMGLVNAVLVQSIEGFKKVAGGASKLGARSEKHALFDVETGTLLTGFIFDGGASCGFQEGVLPVRQNGKWGYINEKGEYLAKCVYEPSAVVDGEERMYSACNGCVILRTEAGFGLMDTKGNVIVEPQFEDMTQVGPEGLLWVKENGKWGIARVR